MTCRSRNSREQQVDTQFRIELTKDALEQIQAYLSAVQTLHPVPESCFPTCDAVYSILDSILSRYAKIYYIAERVAAVLRRGLFFYPARALEPTIPLLLARMAGCFEQTGYASYVWVIAKTAEKCGDLVNEPAWEHLAPLLDRAFEGVSNSLSKLCSMRGGGTEIPDGMFSLWRYTPLIYASVMDDYVHAFLTFSDCRPINTLPGPLLQLVIGHIISALTCPAPEIASVSLQALHRLCRDMYRSETLQPVIRQCGPIIVSLTLSGIVGRFPVESIEWVQGIIGVTVVCAPPEEAEEWIRQTMVTIPNNVLPNGEKQNFLRRVHESV